MILLYGRCSSFCEKGVILISEEEISSLEGIKSFQITSALQMELLARKLAWDGVFKEVQIIEGEGKKEFFAPFKKSFETAHLAANLLLSDAADYGIGAVKNAYACRKRKIRSVYHLKDCFKKIPAIIAGAGPSLISLKPFVDRALIFAGGAALDRLDVKPHFAGSIDKEGPLNKIPSPDTPFCFQSRLNAEVLSQVKGPLLRAPESHFSFLQWLEGEEIPFDGGWTVGNFLASLALLWGCDPIILVGMDFAYRDGKKYAGGEKGASSEGLVETLNQKGEKILTQKDWIMAAQWMSELAKKNPDRTFIDLTGEGLGFSSPIQIKKQLHLPLQKELRGQVDLILNSVPFMKKSPKRWKEWKSALQSQDSLIQEKLLDPLWEIWRSIFAREVEKEFELEIHKSIFFQQVIKEHLDVIA